MDCCNWAVFEDDLEAMMSQECRVWTVMDALQYANFIPLISQLLWLPGCFWVEFKVLVVTHKVFMAWGHVIWRNTSPSLFLCVPPETGGTYSGSTQLKMPFNRTYRSFFLFFSLYFMFLDCPSASGRGSGWLQCLCSGAWHAILQIVLHTD